MAAGKLEGGLHAGAVWVIRKVVRPEAVSQASSGIGRCFAWGGHSKWEGGLSRI